MNHYVNQPPGTSILIQGREYLYFGGTSYLGLQTHPDFLVSYTQNIMAHGSSHGASRNANIRLEMYDPAEDKLAVFTGAPACFTVSSGYMSGQLIRQYFAKVGNPFFHMPSAHNALRLPGDTVYLAFAKTGQALREQLEKHPETKPVLALDSISFNNLEGYPTYNELKELPLQDLILVVDDSHGLGTIEEDGKGTYGLLQDLGAGEIIVCGSLAKAMAVPGGFILGDKDRLSGLQDHALYAGASPMSPAALATLTHNLELVRSQHKKLKENVDYFNQRLKDPSVFSGNPGHPTFTFTDENLVGHLQKNGILVTHFAYSGSLSGHLTRIVITAAHDKAHLDALLDCLHMYAP
ncbi:MAG: 8-amino-7-oxononanoate synthase [Cytophagaceae bacterium]|nr:8-amino-7-oxononanoate synthase [Cytophagaceae bacterium]|tara:strand:- start:489 stop:1541 length:1053 start_codon:yes stop_codon:yes gene_type:complete